MNIDLLGKAYDGYIMIGTVAELLRSLQEAEIRQIEEAGIRHAPTIREMYRPDYHLTEAKGTVLRCKLRSAVCVRRKPVMPHARRADQIRIFSQ